MKRFEQIIEDQFKRLGLAAESDDDTEADNPDQEEELNTAKQNTDKAEDTAHKAGLDAQGSRQELASVKQNKSTEVASKNRDKVKQMGK
tara:strand:+ start:13078 stop:13344 length:267 start_codon:yes stop_codon:yes gene_type:complete